MPVSEASKREPVAGAKLTLRLRVVHGEEIAFGPGKCELLAAIADCGSLSKAARSMRISYMRAWTLVQEMNRGFAQPLLELTRGGAKGGGAQVTDTGRAVIAIYREMMECTLAAAGPGWAQLQEHLRNPVALSPTEEDDDFMEQSIRNELPGEVKSVVSDKVLSEVVFDTALGEMSSVITTRYVREMKLKPGVKVRGLVKATSVSLRLDK